ncbi:MAG: hypothetical protein JWN65_800 [Solirubrobacterales bacterium]|nr:hypothetical protein [Solirubrobacterales bacterium]
MSPPRHQRADCGTPVEITRAVRAALDALTPVATAGLADWADVIARSRLAEADELPAGRAGRQGRQVAAGAERRPGADCRREVAEGVADADADACGTRCQGTCP